MFWPYVRHLRPRHVIYYAYDAHRLAPGWTDDNERFEEDLVARADLIIAFSQGMLDHMPETARAAGRVLPTGVDAALFRAAPDMPPPPDLACIPKPRIGYAGRINQKLDFALVRKIADLKPGWHWVFTGSVGASADGRFAADAGAESLWLQCRDLPNVHVLEQKPHDEVPRILQHMDVNVMCYRTSAEGWWSEIFPLKMLEYLAIGRPVVSTPVKSVVPFAANVAIASTPGQWIEAIEHALANDGVGTAESRRSVALNNTWDQRIDCLDGWMRDLVMPESSVRSPLDRPPARREKQLVLGD
jgi:glycosyltransferase involved in cell wall biosynthesis